MSENFKNFKIQKLLNVSVLSEKIKKKLVIMMKMKPKENVAKQDKLHQVVPKVVKMAKSSDQDESRKSHYDIINILLHRFNAKSKFILRIIHFEIQSRWKHNLETRL